MSTTVSLNAGETLVPRLQSAWQERWASVKLVNEHKFNGITYWWVEMTDKSGMTHLDTMSIGNLRSGWIRKASFYRVGRTYKFKNGFRADVWKILDVYLVERPLAGESKSKAVAKMTTPSGYEDIQTLSDSDFSRMVEV